ncbi:MAG: hypothetical protein R3E39_12425 [Anaerolineae bacterium]
MTRKRSSKDYRARITSSIPDDLVVYAAPSRSTTPCMTCYVN